MREIPRVSRRLALLLVAGLVGVQLGALAAYLETAAVLVRRPRYYLYPFVWITVTAWIALRVRPAQRSSPGLPLLGSAAYLLVLLLVTGTIAPSGALSASTIPMLSLAPVRLLGHAGTAADSVTVEWLAPGWGPYLAYQGPVLTLRIVPFQLLGHLGLAYLFFVTLTHARTVAVIGAGGLVTCVGCVWPAAVAVSAALGSGWSMAAIQQWSYDLSTLLFLGTVGAMCWFCSLHAGSEQRGKDVALG